MSESTVNKDSQKVLLRSLVDNVYDTQGVRITIGNRLVANLRSLGLVETPAASKAKAGKKGASAEKEEDQEKLERENNKVLSCVMQEYDKISEVYATQFNSTGAISKALQAMGSDNVYIKSDLTYRIVSSFKQMVAAEESMIDVLTREVKRHPMWDAFFKNVKGCGPMMAAVCIAYLDPYKARWPSSFYCYCGLDVVVDENGSHARTRRDCKMVEYITKDGEVATKKSLGYNPVLKTKLVGVLGTSFLRCGKGSKYPDLYYDYKNRLQNREDCKDLRPVVIHRRATRYMVKIFLKDLWYAWRELEGLPTGDDYAVAMLGRAPHHDPRASAEQ